MSINVSSAFAVPLVETRLEDADRLNSALERIILALEAQGDAYRNVDAVVHQPPGLFESRFEFFARSEPAVQELRQFCWSTLGETIKGLNSGLANGLGDLQISSQTWFHVTRNGAYFDVHNHPMASWSGVYCVSDGEPDADVPNNGSLVFPHPNPAVNTFLDPANSTLIWPYTHGNFVMNLKPGQLVLFPSWLSHYVSPFKGRRPRITVAFNAWFRRAG